MCVIRILIRTMVILNIDQEHDFVIIIRCRYQAEWEWSYHSKAEWEWSYHLKGVGTKHSESDLTTDHELSSFHWWRRGAWFLITDFFQLFSFVVLWRLHCYHKSLSSPLFSRTHPYRQESKSYIKLLLLLLNMLSLQGSHLTTWRHIWYEGECGQIIIGLWSLKLRVGRDQNPK